MAEGLVVFAPIVIFWWKFESESVLFG